MTISTRIGTGLASMAIVSLVAILVAGSQGTGGHQLPAATPSSLAYQSSTLVQLAGQSEAFASGRPALTPVPIATPTDTVDPAPNDDLALAGRHGVPGRLYCGGRRTFEFDDLENQTGAEAMVGPEYDILRASVGNPPTREVSRDESGVTFLADDPHPGPWEFGRYLSVDVDRKGTSWAWAGSGDCEPRASAPPGYGAATWTLDPAFRPPGPTSRTLHLLVSEWSCSSGRSAHGRIGPAYVTYDAFTVRIELIVESLQGGQDCPAVAATPARLTLSEAVGDRTLKDLNGHLLTGAGG